MLSYLSSRTTLTTCDRSHDFPPPRRKFRECQLVFLVWSTCEWTLRSVFQHPWCFTLKSLLLLGKVEDKFSTRNFLPFLHLSSFDSKSLTFSVPEVILRSDSPPFGVLFTFLTTWCRPSHEHLHLYFGCLPSIGLIPSTVLNALSKILWYSWVKENSYLTLLVTFIGNGLFL